jgi:energy-coupling factor transporter ATP-binding protein EcfA2
LCGTSGSGKSTLASILVRLRQQALGGGPGGLVRGGTRHGGQHVRGDVAAQCDAADLSPPPAMARDRRPSPGL